eukprot:Gb_15665 [translate_table: standard]
MIFLQLVSELSVEDLGEPVYAWELPGVAGNACNGLTPTVALQLAAVVYGANIFFEPLEDLNAAWCWDCDVSVRVCASEHETTTTIGEVMGVGRPIEIYVEKHAG